MGLPQSGRKNAPFYNTHKDAIGTSRFCTGDPEKKWIAHYFSTIKNCGAGGRGWILPDFTHAFPIISKASIYFLANVLYLIQRYIVVRVVVFLFENLTGTLNSLWTHTHTHTNTLYTISKSLKEDLKQRLGIVTLVVISV